VARNENPRRAVLSAPAWRRIARRRQKAVIREKAQIQDEVGRVKRSRLLRDCRLENRFATTAAERDASECVLQLLVQYGQNDCVMFLGRSNPLSAGSLRAGQRVAVVTSLIQSAKLNGHDDPYRYLKEVLERLPTQAVSFLGELLPHLWRSLTTTD
jgi:hypothetical protein